MGSNKDAEKAGRLSKKLYGLFFADEGNERSEARKILIPHTEKVVFFVGTGIMICGLNGCGKSTLGKALACELGFRFIDNENLFFSRSSENDPYQNPKSRDEVINLLRDEVQKFPNFVFAAVKGDYGEEILPFYDYVVLIEVPKAIRLQRVRNRSYQKFGDRMLPGGDLYIQEKNFFSLVESRPEDYVSKWTRSVRAPTITVDGTKSVEENIAYIIEHIHK